MTIANLCRMGDYQCPYCGAAYPIVKRVQKRLGGASDSYSGTSP